MTEQEFDNYGFSSYTIIKTKDGLISICYVDFRMRVVGTRSNIYTIKEILEIKN